MTSAKQLIASAIKINGPMSIATFMKNTLIYPKVGYYSAKTVFGSKGDFVTSPEISQLFGEMIGIKLVDWMRKSSSNDPVHIIELGPGRGTLLSDVLRTAYQFDDIQSKIARCTLIEASDSLQKIQKDSLEWIKKPKTWIPSLEHHESRGEEEQVFILAHEFFDALPIYTFKRTAANQWREVMVGLDEGENLIMQLSQSPTSVQRALKIDELQTEADQDVIEISPEAEKTAAWMKEIMTQSEGGMALIMDYGNKFVKNWSLRAIKDHKIVPNILTDVGECDLSADVNFGQLMKVFSNLETDFKYQGEFLLKLGIRERALQLMNHHAGNNELCAELASSYDRLVNPKEMGSIYKVLEVST